MLRATLVSDLIQLHAATPVDAFTASQGSAFLLVEKLNRSAEMEKRFLTTLIASEDPVEEHLAATSAVTVFSLAPSGVAPGFEASLGRGAHNQIQLDDPAVSQTHLRFTYDAAASFRVGDQGSQNGTKLNGTVLPQHELQLLQDGDVLEIAERYRAVLISGRSLHARLSKQAAITVEARVAVAQEGAGAVGLLRGKVAVITGAGRGLGRAHALRLAEEGCKVVVNDNGSDPDGTGFDPTVAAALVAEIEAAGGEAVASTHDVSLPDEVTALFGLAVQHFGGVDILVCSAGALVFGASVLEPAHEVWERLMAVNLRGTFLCVQAAARHMVESKRAGRIVLTSSMVALTGTPGVIAYSASKAGICGLTLSAAVELAPHGIAVNALTPMAWTRLTNSVPAISAIPGVEQLLSPRRVADVVAFLASDLAAGITGQIVDVGGAEIALYRTERSAALRPNEERWTPQELQRRWPELKTARAAD